MNNRGKNVGLLLTGMALGATLCGGKWRWRHTISMVPTM